VNDFLNKLFGFNHMNLIGWLVAGISLLSVSGFFGYQALESGKHMATGPGPDVYILATIALLLLGIFCLLLQIYCALVVEQINKQEKPASNEFLD
jgi:hypothetical protein